MELRVGVVNTSATYNSQLKSSKASWSVPLHLHACSTPDPNIHMHLYFHKSFIYQIPGHTAWDMNERQAYRMDANVTVTKKTKTRLSFIYYDWIRTIVQYAVDLPAHITYHFGEVEGSPGPLVELFNHAALLGSADQSTGWAYGGTEPVWLHHHLGGRDYVGVPPSAVWKHLHKIIL